MGSTNISIKEEAYKFLQTLKARDESFSDVILKFKEKKGNNGRALLKFAGVLKDVDWQEKKREMRKFREGFNKRINETAEYMEIARNKK